MQESFKMHLTKVAESVTRLTRDSMQRKSLIATISHSRNTVITMKRKDIAKLRRKPKSVSWNN